MRTLTLLQGLKKISLLFQFTKNGRKPMTKTMTKSIVLAVANVELSFAFLRVRVPHILNLVLQVSVFAFLLIIRMRFLEQTVQVLGPEMRVIKYK